MSHTNPIFPAGTPKIEVAEVIGGLIGNGVFEIQDYLYKCLGEGRCYQILDLDRADRIDGLGIAMLENFLARGLEIRLIKVSHQQKDSV